MGKKIDLPQSRAQEIGWLAAASMRLDTLKGQRSQSTRTKPVGNAKVEAYHSASLSDLSGGKVGSTTSPLANLGKSRSSSMPNFHHLTNEPIRPEALQLNSRRFYHPKNHCPITQYADHYLSLMRH